MTHILEEVDKIRKKDKDLLQRVYDFFSPLRERYVTEIRYKEITTKKLLGIFPHAVEDSYYRYDYNQLFIQVLGYGYEKVQVVIKNKILPLQGDIQTVGEFPISLFEHNDYYILHDESIQKFLKEFLVTAVPKYKKYVEWVNHIQDEEKKIFVTSKLEEYFNSEEYHNIRDFTSASVNIVEVVKNKIKEWEVSYE